MFVDNRTVPPVTDGPGGADKTRTTRQSGLSIWTNCIDVLMTPTVLMLVTLGGAAEYSGLGRISKTLERPTKTDVSAGENRKGGTTSPVRFR